MMRYRRTNAAGGTYFFTVNLANRRSDVLVRHIDEFRAVINGVKANHPPRWSFSNSILISVVSGKMLGFLRQLNLFLEPRREDDVSLSSVYHDA